MKEFFIFFVSFIVVFAGVFAVVEIKFSDDDYPSLPYWILMIIQTYRNGIGDI